MVEVSELEILKATIEILDAQRRAAVFSDIPIDFGSEADFTDYMVNKLRQLGWMAIHHPYEAGKPLGDFGFPDIVAAKGGRLIFLELKVKDNAPSESQLDWLYNLKVLPPTTFFTPESGRFRSHDPKFLGSRQQHHRINCKRENGGPFWNYDGRVFSAWLKPEDIQNMAVGNPLADFLFQYG